MSNALGGGKGSAARRSTWMAGVIVLCATFLVAAAVLSFRNSIGLLFSSDPDVIHLVAAVSPFLAFSLIGDGVNGTFAGGRRCCSCTLLMCLRDACWLTVVLDDSPSTPVVPAGASALLFPPSGRLWVGDHPCNILPQA